MPTASRPEQNGWIDGWVVWLPADAPPEREALTEGLALARQRLDHRPRPAHHHVAVVVPSTVLVAMAADMMEYSTHIVSSRREQQHT